MLQISYQIHIVAFWYENLIFYSVCLFTAIMVDTLNIKQKQPGKEPRLMFVDTMKVAMYYLSSINSQVNRCMHTKEMIFQAWARHKTRNGLLHLGLATHYHKPMSHVMHEGNQHLS